MTDKLSKRQVKERIEKLKKLISHHRYLYHVLDREEISAPALDSLKHELYKLEQKYPEFITSDSPTQRVAGKPLKGFRKVRHKVPMLSIEDIFTREEFDDWENYLRRLKPEHYPFEYFAELKIDGFGISLVYEKGMFNLGSTRGNGKVGEDVTQNLKTIESIPLKLKIHNKLPLKQIEEKTKRLIKEGEIEIRGEVYMDVRDFQRLNGKLERDGKKTYSNPRNLAAGSIRQLDPRLAATRPLKFLAYDIVSDLGQKKHSQEHEILPALGFRTNKSRICEDLNEAVAFWKETEKKREKYPFEIDGVVVTVNDNFLFEELGVAGKSPRGIRALKFSPKQATTILNEVKFQVGRTGAVTPVAVLEPVEVAGVKITRATLHNEDEIKRLGVKIGDTVIVDRAGDVIPKVVRALPELRSGKERKIYFPRDCPVCGTKLIRPEGEAIWRCPNLDCPARKREYFYHFVSAFDILGIGPKIIDRFLDEGLIFDPADLFFLKEDDVLHLERFAEKSARNLISAVRSKKEILLARFIWALGIRNVGEETAQDLAEYFGSLGKLKNASEEELQKIPDIGPVAAKSIKNFFGEERNLKLIEKLKKAGVKINQKSSRFQRGKNQSLKGKTFILTGGLEIMTRNEAKNRIREARGKVSESVSRKTDFVVAGKNPGSKYQKAKRLGIKIISEKEFLGLL